MCPWVREMDLSASEIEHLRLISWQNRAKGRGVRWRMIRDVLAVVSSSWMTLFEVQDCLVRLWGLTRNKTREILEEMVSIGDVLVEKDEKFPHQLKYYLKPERVNFWLGPQGIPGIPAGIVQVVELTKSASALEANRRIPGGPSA